MQYLYNSAGEWIAFRDGIHVYDPSGRWLGWTAWATCDSADPDGRCDVADPEGRYLGTIYPGDRFYRRPFGAPEHGSESYPGYPGSHDRPLPPEIATAVRLPLDAEDIHELQAA